MPFFHTVKMNGHEALRLAGESSGREPTPQEAVQLAGEFVRRGQTRCYITLGRNGVAFAQRGGSCGHLPALPVTVRGASGAGDAFMAGAVYGELRGMSLEQTARFATAASAVALSSLSTVSADMSEQSVSRWLAGPLQEGTQLG